MLANLSEPNKVSCKGLHCLIPSYIKGIVYIKIYQTINSGILSDWVKSSFNQNSCKNLLQNWAIRSLFFKKKSLTFFFKMKSKD